MKELKALLDPSITLLEKFKATAPGTYAHCINVSNLCESIAKDMGLDIDAAKVSGMYHDIGKMFNAGYFTENQSGDDKNPHDDLDPVISYQIITRHVSDALLILINEESFPREILEIISRHHGDTLLASIYNKTKGADEQMFRYKTNRPNNDLSSILMIADSVEATSRSMYYSGKLDKSQDRKKVIKDTINRLRLDEQLDEMKVGVLRRVEELLFRELDSIYHPRVDYDKMDDDEDIESADEL